MPMPTGSRPGRCRRCCPARPGCPAARPSRVLVGAGPSWTSPPKEAGQGRPDRPAEQGAALDRQARPSGLPSRAGASAGPAGSAPRRRPGRAAGSAAAATRVSASRATGSEQDPPALAGERADPLGPADRRQPGQPGQLAAVSPTTRSRYAPPRPPAIPLAGGALGQLGGERRDAGEDQPVRPRRGQRNDRPPEAPAT